MLAMMVRVCNLSTEETDTGGSQDSQTASMGYLVCSRHCHKIRKGTMVTLCETVIHICVFHMADIGPTTIIRLNQELSGC